MRLSIPTSIDDRKIAVSRQPGLVPEYCLCQICWICRCEYDTQLEHVVAFLSRHADGPLKNIVEDLQNKLIELRASIHAFLLYCMRVCDLPDNVIRLTQFMMTSLTLRRRTSDPNTHTASLTALIIISAILAWARLTRHTRVACSRRTRSRITCFQMLVLSLIPSSSVKRLRPWLF